MKYPLKMEQREEKFVGCKTAHLVLNMCFCPECAKTCINPAYSLRFYRERWHSPCGHSQGGVDGDLLRKINKPQDFIWESWEQLREEITACISQILCKTEEPSSMSASHFSDSKTAVSKETSYEFERSLQDGGHGSDEKYRREYAKGRRTVWRT